MKLLILTDKDTRTEVEIDDLLLSIFGDNSEKAEFIGDELKAHIESLLNKIDEGRPDDTH